MYIPKHFEETRVEVLHELIRAHPLAALVINTQDGLDANHIPFEINPEPAPFGALRGHVARSNPVWRQVSPDVQALAIFQGPNTYVSPSWYPSRQETGKVVPTWNYAVVHAYGRLRVIEDRMWLRRLVERLTNEHERAVQNPWSPSEAPANFIDEQLNAIVGLEMPIERMIGKWKVSQNRLQQDQGAVIEALRQEDSEAGKVIADLIRRYREGEKS